MVYSESSEGGDECAGVCGVVQDKYDGRWRLAGALVRNRHPRGRDPDAHSTGKRPTLLLWTNCPTE